MEEHDFKLTTWQVKLISGVVVYELNQQTDRVIMEDNF
jgi:hypothetical protein